MRKAILLLLLLPLLNACYNTGDEREHVLKIYNWADYIGDGVLEDFQAYYKEQTGEEIRIVYQTFDINEIMLTKIERGHEDYDVVCPSEYIIERMLKRDLLLPIDTVFNNASNLMRNIAPYIREQLDKISQPGRPANRYAAGYMWGTAGILYNTAHVTREEASTWESLWGPKFKGKILMKESSRDAYGTAIIYAHTKELADGTLTVNELMNDQSPEAMELVEKTLKALKPNVAGWETDFGKEMMTKGELWINMTWSGDAVWSIEEAAEIGVNLDYVVPREGSNVWYDGWVIPKYARNPKAASYFINFMCRPDIALRNMDAIGYVSAIATPEILESQIDTTLEYTSDLSYFFGEEGRNVQVDGIRYPDISVVNRCAMIRDFGDQTREVMAMWSRVKGDNLGFGMTTILVIALFVCCGWIGYKRYRRYVRRKLHRQMRMRRHKQFQPTN
ncbi:MAG: ABC transporter substrate-binding protein [Mediterranea sp.]|jgi:spermidine/putrescine transport system substrate-binding protein|nr:ABC transporter substrate-binding protein [Mediterranea sp.]